MEKIEQLIYKHTKLIVGIAAGLVAIIGIQFLYPSDRALPFAKLDHHSVGFNTKAVQTSYLRTQYASTGLLLSVKGKQVTTTASAAGLVVDYTAATSATTNYPWYLRLIPFSLLTHGASIDKPVTMLVKGEHFSEVVQSVQAACTLAPKDAGVSVSGDKVVLQKGETGTNCSEDSLKAQLQSAAFSQKQTTVTVKPAITQPTRSDKDVEPLLSQAQKIIDQPLTLTQLGKAYVVPKATIAAWLGFSEDAKTKDLTIVLNPDAVTAYLQTIQKDIYIAPGKTVVTKVDGIETARVVGASGRGIDTTKTIAALSDALLKSHQTSVAVTLAPLAPTITYQRSYTKSQAGLAALLGDLVEEKGNYGISIRQLSGAGWTASAQGDKQYETASTYKLFVAYAVLKRVEAGQMSWNDQIDSGRNADQCFDDMIVQSDNECAEAFGTKIGWSTIQSMVRAQGLTHTTLGTTFYSTPNDEALFLEKLEKSQILTGASRDKLLSAMKRQVYRAGIPAGVGVPVADKVGFLSGLFHDAAIVYAPSGTYVLVIMTSGSNWANIADTAKQISQFLN